MSSRQPRVARLDDGPAKRGSTPSRISRPIIRHPRLDQLDAAVNTRLMLARALYASGRYREAIDHAHDVVAILGKDVERGSLRGLNQTVSARVWLVLCHTELGEFEAGAARGAEALRLADRVAGEHERLWARLGIGRLHVPQGDFPAAIKVLEPAPPLYEGEFAIYLSRVASSLGVAYAALGLPEGLVLLERAVDHARAIGFLFGYSLTLSPLGRGLLLADQRERALAIGSRALEEARQAAEQGNEAWVLHLLGDLAASGRDHRLAEERYREALAVADRLAMAPVRARCLEGLRSLTDAGDHRVPHTSTASVV